MGVPKFYRWASERYPLINQKIGKDTQFLPKFDNMYLDMNGIIHTCTHPNDEDFSSKISYMDMVTGMFSYIDRMVQIVRPQKVLVLAVDGCAPRAKMNQQRSRRFASAKDRRDGLSKALREGTMSEEEVRAQFDSNCITPGTEFMEGLSAHFRYFVRMKIKEDPLWRKLEVVYSGHDVPGEGEHKIMDYIRHTRMQPGYDPNTRHCLCGLDADLIMLGLASHEPHFSLLREEVDFTGGRGGKKGGSQTTKEVKKQVEQDKWELLHVNALRQYLDLEFRNDALPFGYDLERIIDDWVLLVMLVGNDFLPHLPSLSIAENGLNDLMSQYRQLLPQLPGYLTEGAVVHFDRLEVMLRTIGVQEDIVFDKRIADSKKKRRGFEQPVRMQTVENSDGEEVEIPAETGAPYEEFAKEHGLVTAQSSFKQKYYAEKFGVLESDRNIIDKLVLSYIEGIQWCFQYYYQGVQSWTWFFPFHYAPMASDMVNLSKYKIELTRGAPFKPFMQLLGCLPADSAQFLPKCYRELMCLTTSPLAEFYPREFRVDMNGKRNPWEGVNLLPFIDETKVVNAVREHCPDEKLNERERQRNEFGYEYIYKFDPSVTSTLKGTFNNGMTVDIPVCQTSEKRFLLPPMEKFDPNLLPGAVADGRWPGDPQLYHGLTLRSDRRSSLKPIGICVFNRPSKAESMVINVRPPVLPGSQDQAILAAAEATGESSLGQAIAMSLEKMQQKLKHRLTVFVNYPNLREAQVMALADDTYLFTLQEEKRKQFHFIRSVQTQAETETFYQVAEEAERRSLVGAREVGTGGLDIGEVELLVKVRPLQRMEIDFRTGSSKQVFSDVETWIPYQLICYNNPAIDERFVPRKPRSMQERFPLESKVMCLQKVGYGLVGKVVGYEGSNIVRAEFNKMTPQIPPFGHTIANSIVDQYINSHKAAKYFGIDAGTLGKVTGSILLRGKYDIGLNLKVGKSYAIPGYVRTRTNESQKPTWSAGEAVTVLSGLDAVEREQMGNSDGGRSHGGWEYTSRALELIAAYRKKFPMVFDIIQKKPNLVEYEVAEVFGPGAAGKEVLAQVCKWLEQIDTFRLPLVPTTSSSMSRDAIIAVQRASDDVRSSILSAAKQDCLVVVKLSADVLFKHGSDMESDWIRSPTSGVPPRLGDRVANLGSPVVPFGLGGTVVATHPSTGCVEVLFDQSFVGGTSLYGACSNNRGKLLPWNQMLNLSKRTFLNPSKKAATVASSSTPQKQKQKKNQKGESTFGSKASKPTKLRSKKSVEMEKKNNASAAQKKSVEKTRFKVPPPPAAVAASPPVVLLTSDRNKKKVNENKDVGNLDKDSAALLSLMPGETATCDASADDDLASYWLQLQSAQKRERKPRRKKKEKQVKKTEKEAVVTRPTTVAPVVEAPAAPAPAAATPAAPAPVVQAPAAPTPAAPAPKVDPLDALFQRAAKATGKDYKAPTQQPPQHYPPQGYYPHPVYAPYPGYPMPPQHQQPVPPNQQQQQQNK